MNIQPICPLVTKQQWRIPNPAGDKGSHGAGNDSNPAQILHQFQHDTSSFPCQLSGSLNVSQGDFMNFRHLDRPVTQDWTSAGHLDCLVNIVGNHDGIAGQRVRAAIIDHTAI